MSLLEQVKTDITLLRKAKSKVALSIVTTLYGEAAMVGKSKGNRESTDTEVVQVVKKFIKNIRDTMSDEKVKLSEAQIYDMEYEIEVLSKYMPEQLTVEKLTDIMLDYIERFELELPKDMGKVMKMLLNEYTGKFDGKVASDIIKRM